MNKISLLFIVLFIQFGFAQKSSYSPYSYFGVGETNFSATADNKMMGGNTAYVDSVSVNLNVPASLSKLKFVNYSVGVNLKIIDIPHKIIMQKQLLPVSTICQYQFQPSA